MEFKANEHKNVEIQVGDSVYLRHAIQTHYVQIGEDYIKIIEQYVKDLYQEGDIVSISEKIIGLCQKRVVYKKDVKVGFLAKFLSKFAMKTDAGIGVDSPYKMQFAINQCGRLKVLYAAIMGGIGKIFRKRGVFYRIVGQEISGLDGFYGKVFEDYAEFGIRIPENSTGVCNEIYEKTGVKAMIVDANDINVEILGRCDAIDMTDDELKALIKDNPAGQSKELTPLILIRKKVEVEPVQNIEEEIVNNEENKEENAEVVNEEVAIEEADENNNDEVSESVTTDNNTNEEEK